MRLSRHTRAPPGHTFVFLLVALVSLSLPHLEQLQVVEAVRASARERGSARVGSSSGSRSGRLQSNPVRPPNVTFDPIHTSWDQQEVCMPALKLVEFINHESSEILIHEVVSDDPAFHSTGFRTTLVPPGGSTWIRVIFTPRNLGFVVGKLFVHTNMGVFTYFVHGNGVPNCLGLVPFQDLRTSAGTELSITIEVTSSLDRPVAIVEVFASDTMLHLSIPEDQIDDSVSEDIGKDQADLEVGNFSDEAVRGLSKQWRIAPGERKSVLVASYSARQPGSFSGSVYLRTDDGATHVVPIHVKVNRNGLHAFPSSIDFGVITQEGESRKVDISLMQTAYHALRVVSIAPAIQDSRIGIDLFRDESTGHTVSVGSASSVKVANVRFHSQVQGEVHGKLVIRTNDTHPLFAKVDVPYHAYVVHGHFDYPKENTSFPILGSKSKTVEKTLTLTSRFSGNVVIHVVAVNHSAFTVGGTRSNILLQPGQTSPPILISFAFDGQPLDFSAAVTVFTNASILHIPLGVYSGKLEVEYPSHGLNFGLVGINEERVMRFNLSNPNPVRVMIQSISSSLASAQVTMSSVITSQGLQAEARTAPSTAARLGSAEFPSLTLEPGHGATFTVEVLATKEEHLKGHVSIKTNFEELDLALEYQSLRGTLSFIPALVRFDPSFPGRVMRRTLYVKSTYERTLEVSSLATSDARLKTHLTNATLLPGMRTAIGFVEFDPSQLPFGSNTDVLESLNTVVEAGSRPLSEGDIQLMESYSKLWEQAITQGDADIRALVHLHTGVATSCALAVRASLSKPSVLRQGSVHFPLTQTGSSAKQMVRISNPADVPVVVQLLVGNFSSQDSFVVADEAQAGVTVEPHSTVEVGPVFFMPKYVQQYSGTLYVRNNLTLLQSIPIKGESGSGNLVWDYAGGSDTLSINIDSKALAQSGSTFSAAQPQNPDSTEVVHRSQVTVVRSFVVRNSGNLPISVKRLGVGEQLVCSSNGLTVMHCDGFEELAPGEHTPVTITFKPQYAAKQYTFMLASHTSAGAFDWPLVIDVDAAVMDEMSARLPQQSMGSGLIRKFAVPLAFIAGAIVLAAVWLEMRKSVSVVEPSKAQASAAAAALAHHEADKVVRIQAEQRQKKAEKHRNATENAVDSGDFLAPTAQDAEDKPLMSEFSDPQDGGVRQRKGVQFGGASVASSKAAPINKAKEAVISKEAKKGILKNKSDTPPSLPTPDSSPSKQGGTSLQGNPAGFEVAQRASISESQHASGSSNVRSEKNLDGHDSQVPKSGGSNNPGYSAATKAAAAAQQQKREQELAAQAQAAVKAAKAREAQEREQRRAKEAKERAEKKERALERMRAKEEEQKRKAKEKELRLQKERDKAAKEKLRKEQEKKKQLAELRTQKLEEADMKRNEIAAKQAMAIKMMQQQEQQQQQQQQQHIQHQSTLANTSHPQVQVNSSQASSFNPNSFDIQWGTSTHSQFSSGSSAMPPSSAPMLSQAQLSQSQSPSLGGLSAQVQTTFSPWGSDNMFGAGPAQSSADGYDLFSGSDVFKFPSLGDNGPEL